MENQTLSMINLERDINQNELDSLAARDVGVDDDPPIPEPKPPKVTIGIISPANNASFSGSAPQGVTITAKGSITKQSVSNVKVSVQFGNSSFIAASLTSNNWTFTKTITQSGPLTITARVTGTWTDDGTTTVTDTSTRNVTVNITPVILPTLTISQPAANGTQVNEANGQFPITLAGTATASQHGVKRVEYSFDGFNFSTLQSSSSFPVTLNWQSTINLSFKTTTQTISVRVVDGADRISAVSQRTLVTIDKSAPILQITVPGNGTDLPGTDAGAILPRIEGTVFDKFIGVQKVEWAVGNAPFAPASLGPGNKWSVQNVPIPGPAGPNKTIRVRCSDKAGNTSAEKTLNLSISLQYPPKDPTVQEYFSSLLDFIVRRVKVTNVNPQRSLRIEDLTAQFYQPFQSFLDPNGTLGNQEVHQIRISIEVLRQYMLKNGLILLPPNQDTILTQAESNYRQAAYESLLRRIGTSFAEIRSARLANAQTRKALAQRLGFDLPRRRVSGEPSPDFLDQMLLQPGKFTEADLESLFGLVDTTRDPLQPSNAKPSLLDWQEQFLKTVWLQQDNTTDVPIIDPDAIADVDLQPQPNPAYEIWQERRMWVENLLLYYKQERETQTNPLTAFDYIVEEFLGPVADLLALEARYEDGIDIEPELIQLKLKLPAFVRLMGLRKLAAAGIILDSEWEDVYSILVQATKLHNFGFWRQQEQKAKLILSADFFRIPDPEQAIALPGVAPEWRVTAGDRRLWQETLRSRIAQQDSLRQALLSAVDVTEEETLPQLRDALVATLIRMNVAQPDSFGIDMQTSGYQKITRVEQAVQTLQSLLISLRMGRLLLPWVRDPNIGSQESFDEELRWMGSYTTWYSAMQVFLYPENFLQPTLRPVTNQTTTFQQLLKNLRKNPQLTPEQARNFAGAFQITEQQTRNQLLALRAKTRQEIEQAPGTTNPPLARLASIPVNLREKYYFVPVVLALYLHKSGQYLAALDWFQVVYAYNLPISERKIYYGLELERDTTPGSALVYQRNVSWLAEALNPHEIVTESYDNPVSARYDAYTRFVVISLVRCLLDFADAEFTRDTNESLPRARSLYMQSLDLLDIQEMKPPAVNGLSPNPVVVGLKLRAQSNLAKLRSGRNITGFKRQLEQASQRRQIGDGLVQAIGIGSFGTSIRALQPTPYRYSVLIDRAKQLVTIAQQIEAAYFAALEKRDGEAYNLLKANQDLGLAQANVQLQDLRAIEATDSIVLAESQQQRAEFQAQTYKGFLDAGMNEWEKRLLSDYKDARNARNWIAGLDAAITTAQALNSAASGGLFGTGLGGGIPLAIGVGLLSIAKAGKTIEANNIEARIQEHSLKSSIEQRQQDWTLQLGVAQKDIAISAQQRQLALDHQNIVGQEQAIAQIQNANAQATVEFLSLKFTNVELYEWMSGVLQEIYSYFLQQATAMAQLAQNQLAFERQESPPSFIIQNDYWQLSTDDNAFGSSSNPDRRGLTGSARLLQDIYQLDQFAFETNKRKLQLMKTLSLAQLAPLEFQRFRETGVLTFATPMQLFDGDFPGHYLRLIKRVRTSVIALIPPHQGIKATLTTSGVSRVVIGGDAFQTISVQREPESVALTSPSNATGLFELEPQSEFLLPFELTGVDAIWNLEMPKPANQFDYRTIADVLISIEYTALSSLEYKQQVIQQLSQTITSDRSFSLRDRFPDLWYDLHNPDQTDTPLTIEFQIQRDDFPPNLSNLRIEQLVMYFVRSQSAGFDEVEVRSFNFTPEGSTNKLGGPATSIDDAISTRRGNASSWLPIVGRSPFGKWELALPDTVQMRELFAKEQLEDILLVITYSGRTPNWLV